MNATSGLKFLASNVLVMPKKDLAVGPYSYTATDVKRTIAALPELREHHSHGLRDADARAAFESEFAHLTATIPPDNLDSFLTDLWDLLSKTHGNELTSSGTVHSLQANGGGVPKPQIPEARVEYSGVVGDVQESRYHHGRPWQALCIWSREVIDAFAAAGDPITYGSAGENITITGIDWSLVMPGSKLTIGEVNCFVTAFAIPCSQNKAWFTDGNYRKMGHQVGDVSRVYAMVTKTGIIRPGDRVSLFR